LGAVADAEFRYSYDSLENDKANTSDSETQQWDFSLTSGRQFRGFNWVLSANQSELEYSNNAKDESSEVNADFQFRINRQFTADFGIGYEENEYNNALRQYSNTDGETWTVGTTWTPHPRMTMKLAYVDRFTGGNWDMDLKYRHRKSVLTASYSTSVTNSRNQQLDTISTTSTDISGDTIFIGDQDLLLNQLVPTLAVENIVQSQFKLAYEYSSRRTTVKFNTTYSERDYQTQSLSTEDLNTKVSLKRKLTPLTAVNTSVNWVNRKDVSAQSDEELVTINLGVSTEIGKNSDFSVDLQRSENEDSTGTNDYDENRVTASLAMTF
ncbi:MAG: TIGR03016 family PEP-CTERM system-associated outer membrane protein, partial [Gammaproteobacteria bacterium]|nr:TIGR03016 family PEP-CTERM system-associated outer membrane protein [Gammaproteobacteria bacterium]